MKSEKDKIRKEFKQVWVGVGLFLVSCRHFELSHVEGVRDN